MGGVRYVVVFFIGNGFHRSGAGKVFDLKEQGI